MDASERMKKRRTRKRIRASHNKVKPSVIYSHGEMKINVDFNDIISLLDVFLVLILFLLLSTTFSLFRDFCSHFNT